MHTQRREPLTAVKIIAHLEKILSSPLFLNSGVLSTFLNFVVRETLEGHEKTLKEYTIGVHAFAKKADFNPQLDAIVRINAGRLRRTLHEYYHTEGAEDEVLISIPKGTYAAEFSYKEKSEPKPGVRQTPVEKKPVIAVLPFRNINPDSSNVFFADGIADQISTELVRYTELSVISYYSCRSIVSKITDIREVAILLNTQYILTGTVQTQSEHLQVRVQLIHCDTGKQIWSNSYGHVSQSSDLFNIQNEIVQQVISQVAGNYGAISRAITENLPAQGTENLNNYNAISWYYLFVNATTEDLFNKAATALREAVKSDPHYAMGWAVLGEVYIGGNFMGFKDPVADDLVAEAIKCGRKAIKIDPLCQQGYQTLSLGNLFKHSQSECLKILEEWISLKPADAGKKGSLGFCLICCGEYDRGYKMLHESIRLNPYYEWWFNGGASFYYFHKGDFHNAIHWARKMNMPHVPWESILVAASLSSLDYMDEAISEVKKIRIEFPFLEGMLKDVVGAFLQDKKLVQQMLESLAKAGLGIEK